MYKNIILLPIACVLFLGCSNINTTKCFPVLFPYPEYLYKAELEALSDSKNYYNREEKYNLFNLTFFLTKEWSYEKISEDTIKFKNKNDRVFILSLNTDKYFSDDWQSFRFVGCTEFKKEKSSQQRSVSSYYYDLFMITDEKATQRSDVWYYYILWSKTNLLRDAIRLVKYQGKNIDAYQKNIDPKCNCSHGSMRTHIAIFPKSISPNYITITAGFTDDDFFLSFLTMLNELNP